MNFIRLWLARPLRWVLLLLCGPPLLAALGLVWLDTASGKRLIERALGWATARYAPIRVELTGLAGAMPFEPRFDRLRLYDRQGLWLEIESFALDLAAKPLLSGAVEARSISVARIAAIRAPDIASPPPQSNPEPVDPFDPAGLPIKRVAVGDLSVAALEVGAEMIGGAVPVRAALRLTGIEASPEQISATVQSILINNNKLSGNLQLDVETLKAEGGLTVLVPSLGELAALAGPEAAARDIGGAANLTARFKPDPDGGQAVDLALRVDDLTAAGVVIGDAAADLTATYRDENGPAVEAQALRVAAAGFTLAASGHVRGEEIGGDWRLAPFDLRSLAHFVPALADVGGRVAAEGGFGGKLADPTATATVKLTEGFHPAVAGAGVKPLAAQAQLKWADGVGQIDLKAANGDRRLTLDGKAMLRDGGATLDARAQGMFDLGLVNELLAAAGDSAAGRLNFSAAAVGDVGAPKITAEATINDGAYHFEALGADFSHIAAKAVWDGKRATLERFSADTPQNGKITGQGRLDVSGAAPRLEAKLTARNALLADSPMATVAADADLTMTGALGAAKITGETTLKKVNVRIPRRLPSEVTTLEVVEVGGGRAPAPPFKPGGKALKTGVEGRSAAAIALDVGVVAAPRRVKVSGQGFDGEFGGKVAVRGTAAAPDISGRFTMQRGSLAILGRTFRFTRGVLSFDGGPEIDPRLDVLVETKAAGDTGRIKVQGSPRRPEIHFESANGLPEDQVVSQILFGKTTDRLSPAQGVELAQALASLTGFEGPAGVLTRVRGRLGLDRLDIGADAEGKVTVEAGRVVADGVFVGLRQTADGPKGRVEVEITDSIRIEAGIGSNGAPEVGVGFEIEY